MSEEKDTSNENRVSGEQKQSKQVKKNQSFLWLIVFALAICIAIQLLGLSVFFNIIIVALGIGLVIGVHEFGHFSLAKLTGMKVEAFSLGFPPALLCFKRTEKGFRIRFLPTLIKKTDSEKTDNSDKDEGGAVFYFGGPRKSGETEYRIGLIPFGGFVKILGQEDVGAVKSSDDPRSYANKPAWARALVLTAGVSFNLIAAIVISIIVFRIGIKFIPPVAGYVVPGSPAAEAGLESGDEIIEIAGNSYNLDFSDIAMESGFANKGQVISVKVKREDGTIKEAQLYAEDGDLQQKILSPFGIGEPTSLIIGKLRTKEEEKMLLEENDLKPGDVIRAINGKPVSTYSQMSRVIQNTFEPEVTISIERREKGGKKGLGPDANMIMFETKIPLTLSISLKQAESEYNIGNVYSMVPRLKVTGIMGGLEPDANWVRTGDIILKVADTPEPNFKQLRETTEKYKDKLMPIEVLRTDANGVERKVTAMVRPRYNLIMDKIAIGTFLGPDLSRPVIAQTIPFDDKKIKLVIPQGAEIISVNGQKVTNFYDVARIMAQSVDKQTIIEWETEGGEKGIAVITAEDWKNFSVALPVISPEIPFEIMTKLYKAASPIQAVTMGYRKTISFIKQQYLTLKALVQRKVSAKALVGPVGIVRASYKLVKERQFVDYAYIIGVMVNAAVAVINLVPVLPLDGGALLFLLIEKIKGSPVSEKFQTSLATAGVVLVLLLFIYITVNDIMR